MKTNPTSAQADTRAFTMLELIVVLACCAIVVVLFVLPANTGCGARAERIKCVSNQKQIGLAFRIFANDNNGQYPASIPGRRLYSPNPEDRGQGRNPPLTENPYTETWHHFQVLSNEITSLKILLCPDDRNRLDNLAQDFLQTDESLSGFGKRNRAVSYFVGLNADEKNPQAILGGDRNIAGPSAVGPALDESLPAIPGGVHLFSPNSSSGSRRRWSTHEDNHIHELQGNLFLADGSVQQVSGRRLEDQLEQSRQAYGTNLWLFSFPNDPAP